MAFCNKYFYLMQMMEGWLKITIYASLHFPDSVGHWYNHHCDESYGFVCKRNPENIGQVTDTPTPTIGGYCPERYFGIGKSYIIILFPGKVSISISADFTLCYILYMNCF